MKEDRAFQGVICIHSLDFILMSHMHRLLVNAVRSSYVQGNYNVRVWAAHGHLKEWSWEQIVVWGQKLLQEEEAAWGDLPIFHMEVGGL